MEGAIKGDDALALGVVAGQLHGGLNGLCAGVAVISADRPGHGRDFAQALRQRDHALVIKIGAGHVDQLGGLLLDCRHHLGVAMSCGNHGDSGGEIQEFVAVNVLNDLNRCRTCGSARRLASGLPPPPWGGNVLWKPRRFRRRNPGIRCRQRPQQSRSVPDMWISSAACFWIAATTLGWQCPVETTAIPAEKSRNSLPSTSSTI